jgi:hypothetical protein
MPSAISRNNAMAQLSRIDRQSALQRRPANHDFAPRSGALLTQFQWQNAGFVGGLPTRPQVSNLPHALE